MFPDDERRQYAARQYESLRTEIGQAREAQYNILQWNQAVSGTLFAAALVAGNVHSHAYLLAAQFILGLVLPAILLGGALAWVGEMIRMERAGMYLRFFERATWRNNGNDGLLDTSLFMWENFLWSPPAKFVKAGYRKQNVGYTGVGIYYGIMYVGSLAAFSTISTWWISIVVCAIFAALGCAVIVPPVIQLFTLGGNAPTMTSHELAEWMNELDEDKGLLAQSGTLTKAVTFVTRRTH